MCILQNSTLNANNFDAIVAMNLKLTMFILWLFCYTWANINTFSHFTHLYRGT